MDPTAKIERLKTALEELKGFAERNEKRAIKAVEYARKNECRWAWNNDVLRDKANRELAEAEARMHEATRFREVVVERVKEALRE